MSRVIPTALPSRIEARGRSGLSGSSIQPGLGTAQWNAWVSSSAPVMCNPAPASTLLAECYGCTHFSALANLEKFFMTFLFASW